jgi:hypothetical protein
MSLAMRRRLVGFGLVFALVTSAYVYLQGAVPLWTGAYIARQAEKAFAGQAHVSVSAYPFWKLLSGRFDRLEITGRDWRTDGQSIDAVHIVWYDGVVDMPSLAVGLLAIRQEGSLEATVTLSRTFLVQKIPVSLLPYHPSVAIEPGGIRLSARAVYAGVAIPFTLRGELAPTPDGQALAFVPRELTADGYPLPVPPSQVVFHLKSIPLPKGLHLWIRRVELGRGTVTLHLSG